MDLLYRYVIVGGLPDVVNCFLETKNVELIYKMQRNLLAEYEEDFLCKSGQKLYLSLIHISEPTRHTCSSRMPSSA